MHAFGTFRDRLLVPACRLACLFLLGLCSNSAQASEADESAEVCAASETPPKRRKIELEASWDDGLWFTSADQQFRIHVGGSAQIDSTWLIGPQSAFALPNGQANGIGNAAGTFLRRARLRADGGIFEQFDYIVEYDFANAANENEGLQPPSFGNLTTAPVPTNIWMQMRDVPYLGTVRVGNQTKPIGMSNNTNQGWLPFMERPDVNDAFYSPFDNGYALGVSSRHVAESERATWVAGVYRPATNSFGVALNKYAVGARATGLPIDDDDGQRLVHLGLGFWGAENVENVRRARARPELRNGPGFAVPVLVDTGQVPSSRLFVLAPEWAMVLGSWTFQAEYAGQWLTDAVAPNGQSQGTVFFHGGYVEALYFLTGESRAYVRNDGVFGRVVPNANFHCKKGDDNRGGGAWQIGARFSYVNLNCQAIRGGQLYDWTAGVNWYLNPNMTIQFNYILESREGPQNMAQSWINGIGVRAAFNF